MNIYLSLISGFANGPERKDFINEIGLMKTIAEGNNPHVVALIGCVTEKEPLCLITEYLPYGDLLSYLHTIRKMVMNIVKKRYLHTHI
jgi:abelson tyrosine-protein kinase 2